ncbi:MAG: hypothetical protein ACRC2M_00205, partial [Planktothrix sp.]
MAIKSPKTTEQTTEQTPIQEEKMNNQTPQNHPTSMTHYSEYELRNEVLKSQAVKDAFSDARLYLECYDSHFEALKNTGITNLLQSKITEQNNQLKRARESGFFVNESQRDNEQDAKSTKNFSVTFSIKL